MTNFTVYTLNTWGAPYAQHQNARARAIAREILRLLPDVVCLQEVFLAQPRHIIKTETQQAYPHQLYFRSGWIGSGLMILSRHLIIKKSFEKFYLGGKPEDIRHGDYYAGKGIGVARIQLKDEIVDVYNTHTHAQYDDDEYAFYTLSNLWQSVHFIRRFSENVRHVLVGDLNSLPNELGYQVVRQYTPLNDAFSDRNPEALGFTFRAANPYVRSRDQRLDYVLYSSGLRPVSCSVIHSDTPTTGTLALSDHDALIAEFSVTEQTTEPPNAPQEDHLKAESIQLAVREMKLTDNQELSHIEGMLSASLIGLDLWRQLSSLQRFSPRLTRFVRRFVLAASLSACVVHLTQLLITIPKRRTAITHAIDDIISGRH
jgi:endonuclease/exonuclease/phosphatase family metal-dependent hydrolase